MQATATAAISPITPLQRAGALGRAIPIACGCALAGSAFLVARFDPSAPGSRFPACQFHSLTGLWCPGCGLTRGFHQLLTGHPLSALQFNIFVPLALVAIIGSWWSWMRRSWGRQGIRVPRTVARRSAAWLPAALVLYGVLRNIPVAPFKSLAP